MRIMWKKITETLSGSPGQLAVARKMIENGLSIREDGKVCCGPVEVKEVSLARAAGVDRRVVSATVQRMLSDKELSVLFLGIKPAGALLRDVAHGLGFGVVELEADAKKPSIIAKATGLLSEKRISIRQIYAKDPELFENPTLVIITERGIPGSLINEFSRIPGVKKVSIL